MGIRNTSRHGVNAKLPEYEDLYKTTGNGYLSTGQYVNILKQDYLRLYGNVDWLDKEEVFIDKDIDEDEEAT